MVETLIYHGKLANQIARLAAIVVKNWFLSGKHVHQQQHDIKSKENSGKKSMHVSKTFFEGTFVMQNGNTFQNGV